MNERYKSVMLVAALLLSISAAGYANDTETKILKILEEHGMTSYSELAIAGKKVFLVGENHERAAHQAAKKRLVELSTENNGPLVLLEGYLSQGDEVKIFRGDPKGAQVEGLEEKYSRALVPVSQLEEACFRLRVGFNSTAGISTYFKRTFALYIEDPQLREVLFATQIKGIREIVAVAFQATKGIQSRKERMDIFEGVAEILMEESPSFACRMGRALLNEIVQHREVEFRIDGELKEHLNALATAGSTVIPIALARDTYIARQISLRAKQNAEASVLIVSIGEMHRGHLVHELSQKHGATTIHNPVGFQPETMAHFLKNLELIRETYLLRVKDANHRVAFEKANKRGAQYIEQLARLIERERKIK